ncbi:RIP metalloprotease RseP [Pacificoceanicola onchidii]|uniref:RIP metalloprotease RseP n=1 Tax=Pacificoceanicola onchidii TaxID=2562685 RepID=UPI0010A61471|nr:RIP metalloprotease RseP [Pacificoceanicola onchidii]
MEFTTLVPMFGGSLWTIAFFIVTLSVIVAIHEYGHYIVGKKSGIYPEVFSLGFGPVIWSKHDRDGTKWQIAAIPFGGYVKFRGDANPSGGRDAEVYDNISEHDRRTTMDGAPLWARTATVAAGPLFNFVMSLVIFAGIFLYRGQTADPLVVSELKPLPFVQELQEGDQILAIAGKALPSADDRTSYDAFMANLPFEPQLDYRVLREGREMTVQGPYFLAPIVGSVAPRSASMDAGLQVGDVITKLNGQDVFAFNQLPEVIENSGGAPAELEIWRNGEVLNRTLIPRRVDEPQDEGGFRTVYRIGLGNGILFEPAMESIGFGEALTAGARQVGTVIHGSLSGLWHMATGAISSCNLSGAIGIAQTAGDMASLGLVDFIGFIAVLSTAIGLLNLFPIPVLDGGHLVFYAYEAISGRKPSDQALRVLMSIGLTVVLALMIFGLSNDLFCH